MRHVSDRIFFQIVVQINISPSSDFTEFCLWLCWYLSIALAIGCYWVMTPWRHLTLMRSGTVFVWILKCACVYMFRGVFASFSSQHINPCECYCHWSLGVSHNLYWDSWSLAFRASVIQGFCEGILTQNLYYFTGTLTQPGWHESSVESFSVNTIGNWNTFRDSRMMLKNSTFMTI